MASLRATSRDGRVWNVSVHRVRFPGWRQSSFEVDEDAHPFVMALEFVVIAPLFWLVFPLFRAALLLPVAFARSLSSTRWNLTPPQAEQISMTEPPGLDDRDA